ncbi:MAG TPA: hypothetical protein VF538_12505 [Pyrinomonadaceae bacterium]|jgi:hypothetical protein
MSGITVLATSLATALLLAACTTTGAQSWRTHQDPSGFSVEAPQGWRVRNDSGRVTVAGANAERVTIYPLRVEGQLDAKRAYRLMTGIASQLSPGQRWGVPRGGWQFGTNGVRAVGADESSLRETTALWWANSGRAANGFFYAVAAQPARFQTMEPVFARILGSFRVTQSAAGGGARPEAYDPLAGLQFQRWVDPTESAFSVEVPAGWRVWGGIKRASTISRQQEVVAQSPDGQINVRSGDVRLPPQYIEPNQTLDSLGTHEGQLYPGTTSLVLRFRPAAYFAAEYAQRNMAQNCGNLRLLRQADRPDYIQGLASRGLLLSRNQYTAGEVVFTCQMGRQSYVGYLFAETSINRNPGVGNVWNVSRLDGFLAPAERATQADAVLQRLSTSFAINPQWWRAEVGADERIAAQFRGYREFTANLQQQTRDARWASWGWRNEQVGDTLRGVTRVVDPETGEAYKVEHTSNYYWIDTRNDVIVGTNLPYKPTWDFREMLQTYR